MGPLPGVTRSLNMNPPGATRSLRTTLGTTPGATMSLRPPPGVRRTPTPTTTTLSTLGATTPGAKRTPLLLNTATVRTPTPTATATGATVRTPTTKTTATIRRTSTSNTVTKGHGVRRTTHGATTAITATHGAPAPPDTAGEHSKDW